MQHPSVNYDAKVFIEGVEIPAKSITIQENVSQVSTLSVEIPSVGSYALKPRTLIHAFFADKDDPEAREGAEGDKKRYVLRFSGEIASPAQSWQPRGSSIVITGFSTDNHFDAIPILQYIQGGPSTGGATDRIIEENAETVYNYGGSGGGGGASGIDWGQKNKELAVLGGGFQFALNPDSGNDFIDVKAMGKAGQMGDLKVQSPADMFPILYKTNAYWRNQGQKTRMSDASKYYFYEWYGKTKHAGNFKKIMQEYLKLLAGQMMPAVANFRDFLTFYLQLTFCSYSLNQTRLDKCFLLLPGFEFVIPPLCNVIFPHQFNAVTTYSTNLAAPTRAIAIEGNYNSGGASLDQTIESTAETTYTEGGGSSGGGGTGASGVAIVGYPLEIDRLIQAGNFEALREAVTAEEKVRGPISLRVTLPGALGQAVMKVFGGNTSAGYREFMIHHLSSIFSKAANASASSNVTCVYSPYIQVGLPVVLFKPLADLADLKQGVTAKDLVVVLGYAASVQHVFDKQSRSAVTVVQLAAAETLMDGAHPRPLPYWMDGLGADEFDKVYGEILGCGGVSTTNSTISGLGGGTGVAGTLNTEKGLGSLNVEKEVFSAITRIYDAYETKKTDRAKFDFALELQKRPVVYMEDALKHFKFESDRAAIARELRQAVLEKSRVFKDTAQHSEVGGQDVAADDMMSGFSTRAPEPAASTSTSTSTGTKKKPIKTSGGSSTPKDTTSDTSSTTSGTPSTTPDTPPSAPGEIEGPVKPPSSTLPFDGYRSPDGKPVTDLASVVGKSVLDTRVDGDDGQYNVISAGYDTTGKPQAVLQNTFGPDTYVVTQSGVYPVSLPRPPVGSTLPTDAQPK